MLVQRLWQAYSRRCINTHEPSLLNRSLLGGFPSFFVDQSTLHGEDQELFMGSFWLEKKVVENVSLWVTRCSVLLSFGAHLVLALLAGIRRREDNRVQRFPLWLAYQVADLAPKLAIGKLYPDSPSSSNQLFAFWVPFMLLHLGLTDNISAYSLEDNKLSWRQMVEMGLLLVVALIGAYNQRFLSGDRALCSAFVTMFFLGFYKYAERIWTLRHAGFARIRSSYNEKRAMRFSPHQVELEADELDYSPHQVETAKLDYPHRIVETAELDYYDALCDAHGLLGISMGAFADYAVKLSENPQEDDFRTWYTYRRDVVKVVEMELSLMYDIMYTKAAVVHTWPGYIIRIASPPITLAALLLFIIFHIKEGHRHKGIDITITYTLLIGTLLLDVRWLLRALGSTWTYAFLKDTNCKLLKYKAVCCQRGWWYVLRRFVLYLDLSSRLWRQKESSQFAKRKKESSHRLWSRTIGQHNLLHECTVGTPMNKIGWKGHSDRESVGVESLLQLLCKFVLPKEYLVAWKPDERNPQSYVRGRTYGEPRLFDAEFDQLVITWHIATDIFLLGIPDLEQGSDSDPLNIKALSEHIKALSDYMLFLVVKRPEMLPSLKLQRKYKEVRDELKNISNRSGSTDKGNLARALREMQKHRIEGLPEVLQDAIKYAKLLEKLCLPPRQNQKSYDKDWSRIVSEVGMHVLDPSVSRLLILVTEFQKYAQPPPQLGKLPVLLGWQLEWVLEDFVLQPWIHLLVFGSIRCSRDSHAKQLSNGGELTTIIWILAEHKSIVDVSQNIIQPHDLWTRPSMLS
ncbi:hypothetical protein CFC21_090252 [Triticum aestivum]|uniref:DUF4220 domain-containing protein n=2 Tax=Triticum aestivum TaxID=4565 RepID=A0A9R1MRK8_WHEAT|nr:hypothetical protein CFC21_090252 [Triticum aestivum]